MTETLDILADGQSRAMTIREALELGKSRQEAGDLSGAADIYQQVHNADPGQVDALHLLGVISHRLGEHDLAADLIAAALAVKPDFAAAHSNLGVVYFDQGRMDEAAACYGRAIGLNPEFAEPHHNMGSLYQRLGRMEDAAFHFRKAVELAPDFKDAHVNLGMILNGMGKPDQALQSIRRALALDPGHAMALAAAGGVLFELQEFDQASHHLKQAADQDDNYDCGPVGFFRGDFDARTDPENFDRLVSALPEITGTFPAGSGAGPVVMTSCDHGYFRQFGPALALSVDRYAPGRDLHVHVINPEPSFDHEIATLKQRLDNTVLTLTTETAPGTDRLYFHVIRFVRLCQMMEASGRDFLHLDTDSLVHGPLASTAEIDGGADLSLLTRFDMIPFKYKVAVGSLFVRHTPMARRFMRRFGAYLAQCIAGKELVWGLDQAAFYVVYRMMAFKGEGVLLAPLPETLRDFEFGANSDVWAAKGNRKLNQAFERESSRLLGVPRAGRPPGGDQTP